MLTARNLTPWVFLTAYMEVPQTCLKLGGGGTVTHTYVVAVLVLKSTLAIYHINVN